MITGFGHSHAKTILVGEHSVVYGHPAIAFPIKSLKLHAQAEFIDGESRLETPFHQGQVQAVADEDQKLERILAETAFRNTLSFLGSDANLFLQVTGFIPPARGLGSSAAVAAAIINAIADLFNVVLSEAEHFELVQSVERVAHGTPSGLDAIATSSTMPIWFQNGKAKPLRSKVEPAFLVADTGATGHTAEAVTIVRKQRAADQETVDKLFAEISNIANATGAALETGDIASIGPLMNKNHEILQSLKVSSDSLDEIVKAALTAGAAGAKMTGGGLGGCVLVLAECEEDLADLGDSLLAAGAKSVWNVNETKEH